MTHTHPLKRLQKSDNNTRPENICSNFLIFAETKYECELIIVIFTNN